MAGHPNRDPVPDDYRERIRKMHDYIFTIATPELAGPLFGDASRSPVGTDDRSAWSLYPTLIKATAMWDDPKGRAWHRQTGVDKTFFVLLDEAIGTAEGTLDLHLQLAPGCLLHCPRLSTLVPIRWRFASKRMEQHGGLGES